MVGIVFWDLSDGLGLYHLLSPVIKMGGCHPRRKGRLERTSDECHPTNIVDCFYILVTVRQLHHGRCVGVV